MQKKTSKQKTQHKKYKELGDVIFAPHVPERESLQLLWGRVMLHNRELP